MSNDTIVFAILANDDYPEHTLRPVVSFLNRHPKLIPVLNGTKEDGCQISIQYKKPLGEDLLASDTITIIDTDPCGNPTITIKPVGPGRSPNEMCEWLYQLLSTTLTTHKV